MAELAKSRGVRTVAISRKQIRDVFAFLGSPTRYTVAQAIAQSIQAFKPLVAPKRKIWNGEDRRMGLFDAAALGLTLLKNQGAMFNGDRELDTR